MSDPLAATPPPFGCPDELRALFEETFRAAGLRDYVPEYGELDAAVDVFAREARERGIPPERFLVAMKDCMETSRPPYAPAQRALREHTVTRSLDAFYGSTGMGPTW